MSSVAIAAWSSFPGNPAGAKQTSKPKTLCTASREILYAWTGRTNVKVCEHSFPHRVDGACRRVCVVVRYWCLYWSQHRHSAHRSERILEEDVNVPGRMAHSRPSSIRR